jgi:hypothetical protein
MAGVGVGGALRNVAVSQGLDFILDYAQAQIQRGARGSSSIETVFYYPEFIKPGVFCTTCKAR